MFRKMEARQINLENHVATVANYMDRYMPVQI